MKVSSCGGGVRTQMGSVDCRLGDNTRIRGDGLMRVVVINALLLSTADWPRLPPTIRACWAQNCVPNQGKSVTHESTVVTSGSVVLLAL